MRWRFKIAIASCSLHPAVGLIACSAIGLYLPVMDHAFTVRGTKQCFSSIKQMQVPAPMTALSLSPPAGGKVTHVSSRKWLPATEPEQSAEGFRKFTQVLRMEEGPRWSLGELGHCVGVRHRLHIERHGHWWRAVHNGRRHVGWVGLPEDKWLRWINSQRGLKLHWQRLQQVHRLWHQRMWHRQWCRLGVWFLVSWALVRVPDAAAAAATDACTRVQQQYKHWNTPKPSQVPVPRQTAHLS